MNLNQAEKDHSTHERPNNVNKRVETAPNNGEKRGKNGNPRPTLGQVVQKASDNYRKPPEQHQFKPGNPGGPGAPKGPRSMRKLIRQCLFEDHGGTIANGIAVALFEQAFRGNTHAIRLVVEQSNNRRKGTRSTSPRPQSSQ